MSELKCCLCGRTGHLSKDCKWPGSNSKVTDARRHALMDMVAASHAGLKSNKAMNALGIDNSMFQALTDPLRRAGLLWCVGRTHSAVWVCTEEQSKRAKAAHAKKRLADRRKRTRLSEQRRRRKEREEKHLEPRWPRVASVFELANHV